MGRDWSKAATATAVLAAAVTVVAAWGSALGDSGGPLHLGAAPFAGRWDVRFDLASLPAVIVAVVVVWLGPRVAATAPWRPLLVLATAVTVVWALALAGTDGWDAITRPLTTRYEYLHDLPVMRGLGPGEYVRTYVDELPGYATHVRGHPPGFSLVAWGVDRLGGGALGTALLVIVVGALAVPSAAVVTRAVSDEGHARRLLPVLVVLPAALWLATSADAMFLGVSSVGLACVATASPDGRGDVRALLGGLLLGGALHLSYGVAPLALVLGGALLARRTWRPLIAATVGIAFVTAAFVAAGFWWLDGFSATRREWSKGLGAERPLSYFLISNLVVVAVAVGPAVVARLCAAHHRGVALVAGAGLAAVVVADVSGLSRGEVERIWLPFVPWVAVAASTMRPARGWLAAQCATALILQSLLLSKW